MMLTILNIIPINHGLFYYYDNWLQDEAMILSANI